MFDKLKYVLGFMKALKLDEKGKYNEAIQILLKYDNFIMTNKNKFPDYYILLGELYTRIRKYAEAEKIFLIALKSLNKNKNFNIDEINYLQKYIYKWMIYIYTENKHSISMEKYKKYKNKIIYDDKKIRSALKINFLMYKEKS